MTGWSVSKCHRNENGNLIIYAHLEEYKIFAYFFLAVTGDQNRYG
jgi:hypothetical protein